VADIHHLFDGMIARGHPLDNDQVGLPARPADYSDEALAGRFTARHVDDLRFVNAWGRWLVWDETRWRYDETLSVIDHARALVREASEEILAKDGSQRLAAGVERQDGLRNRTPRPGRPSTRFTHRRLG
jgi:hypothetical protein